MMMKRRTVRNTQMKKGRKRKKRKMTFIITIPTPLATNILIPGSMPTYMPTGKAQRKTSAVTISATMKETTGLKYKTIKTLFGMMVITPMRKMLRRVKNLRATMRREARGLMLLKLKRRKVKASPKCSDVSSERRTNTRRPLKIPLQEIRVLKLRKRKSKSRIRRLFDSLAILLL
jgi:hypothetical protein